MSARSSFTPGSAPAARGCAHAPAANDPVAGWSASLREWLAALRDSRVPLFETATLGHTAWLLHLPFSPDRMTLDLTADLGNTACALARVAQRVVYVCTSDAEAAFVRSRAAAQPHASHVVTVVTHPDGALPFPTSTFHCVVAAPVRAAAPAIATWHAAGDSAARTALSAECLRVLRTDGILVLRADNLLARAGLRVGEPSGNWQDRLAAVLRLRTLPGYRRHLRSIGLSHIRSLGLEHNERFVDACVPLDSPIQPVSVGDRGSLLARWRFPSYVLLACAAPQPASLGEQLLETLTTRLAAGRSRSPLRVRRLSVSRKDKIIIDADVAGQPLIVRIALSEAAREGEERNRDALLRLRSHARLAALIPAAIADGTIQGLAYFAEQRMPGVPLSRRLLAGAVKPWSRRAIELLDLLHAAAAPQALQGARYETLVGRHIGTLTQQLGLSRHDARLRQFFASNLHGAVLPIGLTHGDFGLSNLLADATGLRSLIDWEYCATEDVCATDAINYFDSLLRRADSSARPDVTIPWLASWRAPDGVDLALLRDYYVRHGIDARWHRGLVYLKWLRHVTHLSHFWLRFDSSAIARYVTRVIDALP